MRKRHEQDSVADLLRRFCALICGCHERPRFTRTIKIPAYRLTIKINPEGDIMFSYPDDGPPLQATLEVDDKKGFQTTDTDTPVFASSDSTVAAIDANGVVTPGNPGVCQLTATFGDPAAGGFVITEDTFTVIPGAAAGGKMTFGPVAPPPAPVA